MAERNLLLSGGEKLASRAEIVRGSGPKKKPYSISEVREALLAPIRNIEERLEKVSSEAKPRGEGESPRVLRRLFS
jgi:hypothetical protein